MNEIANIFHTIRKTGNKAAHEVYESAQEAETVLQLAFHLGVWFMQTYGDWDFKPKEYILPVLEDSNEIVDQKLKELSESYEAKIGKLQDELVKLREQKMNGFNEPTATIVWGEIVESGSSPFEVVLWNIFPFHPYDKTAGRLKNRTPKDDELKIGLKYARKLLSLCPQAEVIAIGIP